MLSTVMEVLMPVVGSDYCWEYFNCDKNKECPAKTGCLKNKKCWRVASRQIDYIPSGVKVKYGMKECWNCDFFRLKNGEFFS
jgi:hypothetical protein